MERRPNFQLEATEPVTITPLQQEKVCDGQLFAATDDDVKVQVHDNLAIGSILKLETRDLWMLAEVVGCQAGNEGYSADLTLLNWINKAELKSLFWEGDVEPVMIDLIPNAVAA